MSDTLAVPADKVRTWKEIIEQEDCSKPFYGTAHTTSLWTGYTFEHKQVLRCKSRIAGDCAYCAARRALDYQLVIKQGIDSLHLGPNHYLSFVTLTAPGFTDDDEGLLMWNRHAGRLWTKTVKFWRHALKARFGQPTTVEFVRTWEFQRRGALHAHALVVVHTPHLARINRRHAGQVLRRAIPEADNPDTTGCYITGEDGNRYRWGHRRVRSVVELIDDDDRAKSASYVLKYLTKDVHDSAKSSSLRNVAMGTDVVKAAAQAKVDRLVWKIAEMRFDDWLAWREEEGHRTALDYEAMHDQLVLEVARTRAEIDTVERREKFARRIARWLCADNTHFIVRSSGLGQSLSSLYEERRLFAEAARLAEIQEGEGTGWVKAEHLATEVTFSRVIFEPPSTVEDPNEFLPPTWLELVGFLPEEDE